MSDYTDILIHILKRDDTNFPVEMIIDGQQHFKGHLSADIVPWTGEKTVNSGKSLFDALFDDRELLNGWLEARRTTLRRVRFWIDPVELQTIPWELMQDEDILLAADGNTPFSRYIPSKKRWGDPIARRPIKVLGVISAPEGLEKYALTPLDREKEKTALKEALSGVPGIQLEFLNPPITLMQLENQLQQGYHIIHYVGHGKKGAKEQSGLFFEDTDGNCKIITGRQFVTMLQRLQMRPHLLFLSACYSAETPVTESFQGIAQQAVHAGVPAVIAMQDTVSITTARDFSQKFYEQLLALNGTVDQAVNQARSLLISDERTDAIVPVLFMRLKDATLFTTPVSPPYEVEPSFVGREAELTQLQQGLTEHPIAFIHGMAGSGKTWLARQLAAKMGFDKQSTIEIRLVPGETVYSIWQGLAEQLRVKGFPQFYTGLEGGVQTEKGDWQERGKRLADILRQKRFLIILDDLHHAADLQTEAEGWQALFYAATSNRPTTPTDSRFLLVSREDAEVFSQTLGIELGKHLIALVLKDLPEPAIQELSKKLSIALSDAESNALYLRTHGHAQATYLALKYMSNMSPHSRQEFLARLPERIGDNDPRDPIVRFVIERVIAESAPEERDALDLISIARRSLTQDSLITVLDITNPQETIRSLHKRGLVEWREGGYIIHDMIGQVLKGELATIHQEKLRHLHTRLGEFYDKRGDILEAVYHFRQIAYHSEVLDLLLKLDIHQLNFADLDELRRQADALWSNLADNAQDAEKLYVLALRAGQATERLGKYQNAIEWYNRAIKVAQTECQVARGWIFRAWAEHRGIPDSNQQVDELLREAEKILKTCPQPRADLITLYLFRTRILAEREDVKGSQKAFNSVFRELQIKAPSTEPALITLIKDKPDLVPVLARAYHALGWAYQNSDESKAKRYLQYAKMLYEKEPNRWMVGIMDNNIGANFRTWGKYDQAAKSFADALRIADELGDQVFIRPLVFTNQAIANISQGKDGAAAERDLRSALNLMQQSGYMQNYSIVLETLGRLLARAGKWREAERTISKYSLYAQETKEQVEIFYAQKLQAELALLRIEAGISTCQSQKDRIVALNHCESGLEPYERADLWSFKAEYALLDNDRSAACKMVNHAMEIYAHTEPEFVIGPKIREVRARILALQDQWDDARADFKESFESQKDHFLKGHALYCYAKTFHNDLEAREKMQEALDIFELLPYAWLAYEAWRFLNPEVTMDGISPELYKSLWIALLRCGSFDSDESLRALFVTAPLNSWRDSLPQAHSPSARVEKMIAYLSQQRDEAGNNALVLFLRALSNLKDPGDACKGELDHLAEQLTRELAEPMLSPVVTPVVSPDPLRPSRQITREQKRELVDALLACSAMRDRYSRDAVVNNLRNDIAISITRHNTDRVDVNNIVTRCADFADGIKELLECVRDIEGSSIPMQNVDAVWQHIQGA